jgi:hypothetical protein
MLIIINDEVIWWNWLSPILPAERQNGISFLGRCFINLFWICYFVLFHFDLQQSHYIRWDWTLILLCQSHKCWDNKHVPPCPDYRFLIMYTLWPVNPLIGTSHTEIIWDTDQDLLTKCFIPAWFWNKNESEM